MREREKWTDREGEREGWTYGHSERFRFNVTLAFGSLLGSGVLIEAVCKAAQRAVNCFLSARTDRHARYFRSDRMFRRPSHDALITIIKGSATVARSDHHCQMSPQRTMSLTNATENTSFWFNQCKFKQKSMWFLN